MKYINNTAEGTEFILHIYFCTIRLYDVVYIPRKCILYMVFEVVIRRRVSDLCFRIENIQYV